MFKELGVYNFAFSLKFQKIFLITRTSFNYSMSEQFCKINFETICSVVQLLKDRDFHFSSPPFHFCSLKSCIREKRPAELSWKRSWLCLPTKLLQAVLQVHYGLKSISCSKVLITDNRTLEIKPLGLYLEFEMGRHFDRKQKSK